MKIDEVINYFGSAYKLSKALNISMPTPSVWKRNNSIPYSQQVRIEKITNGELKANYEEEEKKQQEKNKKNLIKQIEKLKNKLHSD